MQISPVTLDIVLFYLFICFVRFVGSGSRFFFSFARIIGVGMGFMSQDWP